MTPVLLARLSSFSTMSLANAKYSTCSLPVKIRSQASRFVNPAFTRRQAILSCLLRMAAQ